MTVNDTTNGDTYRRVSTPSEETQNNYLSDYEPYLSDYESSRESIRSYRLPLIMGSLAVFIPVSVWGIRATVATGSTLAAASSQTLAVLSSGVSPQPPKSESTVENLAYQFRSVNDPEIDICADPYGNMCGRFSRDYFLPDGMAVQTWGFNQVEDEMANQSLVPLEIPCSEALKRDDVDAWTTWLACAFQLCEEDGRYHASKLVQPPSDSALHAVYPEVDTVLREYLPIIRLSSEDRHSMAYLGADVFRGQYAAYLGDLHRIGVPLIVKLHGVHDVLFFNGRYDLKVQGGHMFYGNKDQYSDEAAYHDLRTYLIDLLVAHQKEVLGEVPVQKDIEARVDAVINYETKLAAAHLSEDDKRDQLAINNAERSMLLTTQLEAFLDLKGFLARQGPKHLGDILSDSNHSIVFENPIFLTKVADIQRETHNDVLLDYLLVHALTTAAQHLTPSLRHVAANWVKITTGAAPGDTVKECRSWVTGKLPWIVGRDVVKASEDTAVTRRGLAQRILRDVKNEYYVQVKDAWWMDDDTRQGAYQKLDHMQQQVGWPDWLLDTSDSGYSAYFTRMYLEDGLSRPDLHTLEKTLATNNADITTAAFLRLGLSIDAADHAEDINQVDTPQDFTIWSMQPQDVNAEYFPTTNNFMLPWGVLQAPMLYPWSDGPYSSDQERDEQLALKAASYGGLGSVVAHEIMHGFDDDGRTHDYTGQLKPFSSPSSDVHFTEIIQCISEEYGSFTVNIDGKEQHIHGAQTQGEALADNGGLQTLMRLVSSGKVLPKEDLSRPVLSHLGVDTPLVLLPLSTFGMLWCEKSSSDFIRSHLNNDPHPPGDKRVIGVSSNLTTFGDVLGCPRGTTMNPEETQHSEACDIAHRHPCRVW